MNINDLNKNLIKASQVFELDYKEVLNNAVNNSGLDENSFNTLYDLGATINHLTNSFREEIIKYLKNQS